MSIVWCKTNYVFKNVLFMCTYYYYRKVLMEIAFEVMHFKYVYDYTITMFFVWRTDDFLKYNLWQLLYVNESLLKTRDLIESKILNLKIILDWIIFCEYHKIAFEYVYFCEHLTAFRFKKLCLVRNIPFTFKRYGIRGILDR